MEPENLNYQTTIPNENRETGNKEIINEAERKSCNIQGEYQGPIMCAEWRKVSNGSKTAEKDGASANGIVFNRVNHCTFFYKNCIYVYGGEAQGVLSTENATIETQKQGGLAGSVKQSLWNSFHKFNINTKEYSKQAISFGANTNAFINISSFGHLLIGNLLFVFGGANYETQIRRNPQICSINLESGFVKRYESKTPLSSIPSARINPIITAIEKSILIIFGGEVYSNVSNSLVFLNDMYIFKIETKTWTKIQDSFHQKLPVLIRPSLINFGDNCIYLMGGKRQILHNDGSAVQEVDNFGIYRLRVINKTINSKSDCCVKQILSTNQVPTSETFLKFIKYSQKGIFVLTANSSNPGQDFNIWYYDPSCVAWIKIQQNISCIQSKLMASSNEDFVASQEKMFSIQKNGQIYQLNFNQALLESSTKEVISYYKNRLCLICEEEKNFQNQQNNLLPAQKFEEYCNPIQFPFSSIGLLVDHAILTKAQTCNVVFNMGTFGKQTSENNKSAYLIIEDNGSPFLIWSPDIKPSQYVNRITSCYATIVSEDLMAAEDNKILMKKSLKDLDEKQKNLQKQFSQFMKNQSKANGGSTQTNFSIPNGHFKTEKDFEKEQQEYIERRQRLQFKNFALENEERLRRFCNTIKMAGVSLGDSVSYACKQKRNEQNTDTTSATTDKQIRRYFFMRKEKCTSSGKSYYVCYAYVTENGNTIDPKMEGIVKQCSKQFRKQIKILNERLKTMNSAFLITDLKHFSINEEQNEKSPDSQGIPMKQLRLKKKQNDVFYGDPLILNQLEASNITKMAQCCDISLKTYLGLLYLNNNELNLYICVRQNQLQEINTQPFLNTIDKMLSSRKIIEVTKPLDFSDECSVVEVYWYPEHSQNNELVVLKVNNMGFLLNGILIYHRNRLVSRYGIKLGNLLDEIQINQNYGSVFGYLEIKPEYGANQYLTDMLYPNLLEKYLARLVFVNEFMEMNYKQRRTKSRGDDIYGLQKISKRAKNQ